MVGLRGAESGSRWNNIGDLIILNLGNEYMHNYFISLKVCNLKMNYFLDYFHLISPIFVSYNKISLFLNWLITYILLLVETPLSTESNLALWSQQSNQIFFKKSASCMWAQVLESDCLVLNLFSTTVQLWESFLHHCSAMRLFFPPLFSFL